MSKNVFFYDATTGFAASVDGMNNNSVNVSTGYVGTGLDEATADTKYNTIINKYGASWADAKTLLHACELEIKTSLQYEDESSYSDMRGASIHGYEAVVAALKKFLAE